MRPLLPALVGALLSAAPAAAQTLALADSLYLQGRYAESVAILDALPGAERETPAAYVLIAENQYRLGNQNGALAFADAALELEPCSSAAHNVIAAVRAQQPWDEEWREETWMHARRAVECDPGNGNAWVTYWMSGVMRQDAQAQALAQRRIAETGFIPEPVMEMARWMLRAAPRDAVLFTEGDWDFFPILVAQSQQGLRPDVTVAMRGMLQVPWYVRELGGRAGWPVPRSSAESVDGWTPAEEDADSVPADASTFIARAGTLWAQASLAGGRPLAVATTAAPDFVGNAGYLRWEGPVYTLLPWDQAPPDTVLTLDVVTFAASMRTLDLSRLRGPVVHPTDRSPVRRTTSHPADVIMLQVLYYGRQNLDAGRMQDARQALTWADALIATGGTSGIYDIHVDELRAAVEGGAR